MDTYEGMHAIGYCRVSTDDKGQTTEQQRLKIQEWADSHSVEMDAYFEDNLSGTIFPRPGLAMALVTLTTTPASMLICYDQSRLTRDAENHLPQINRSLGGKVIRYVVNGDMENDSLPAQVINAIKGITDKEERRVLSAKTKLKMEHLRDDCNVHIGRPAVIVITDDVTKLPKGMVSTEGKTKTRVFRPAQVLEFARSGWTPNYVAVKLLNVPAPAFYRALERANLVEEYNAILKEHGGVA